MKQERNGIDREEKDKREVGEGEKGVKEGKLKWEG